MRGDAGVGQALQVLRHAGLFCVAVRRMVMGQVHAQRHRCGLLARLQHRLPVLRVVGLQPLDPPARVVPAGHRVAVGGAHQGVALAQKAAQAGIDEARLRSHAGVVLGRLDRLVHQGEGLVGCAWRIPGQGQSREQQRVGCGRWRAAGQPGAQRLRATELAQRMKRQRLRRRAQRGLRGGQRLGGRAAGQHRLQNAGGSLKLPPERNRARPGGLHHQPRLSDQMFCAQFQAYTPSSSVGPGLTPPEPATVLKVRSAATYSCTLATWITFLLSTKL